MPRDNYPEINSKTWDVWAENGIDWSKPVSPEECRTAREGGGWQVFLTPCVPVPTAWFGSLRDCDLLGLASGGGQQMPLFAIAGARCTLLDNSDEQLRRDRMVAEREGYPLRTVKADMTRPFPFPDNSFDLIFHPVSNCYVRDVRHVWRECARVLRPGGRLLAGFDNGLNFLFADERSLTVTNPLPFDPLTMPESEYTRMADNNEGIQFSHSMEEQLGGQLEAGFSLKALYEDRDRPGGPLLREYAPQYMATLAVRGA